jgi:hypothetical protein
MPRAVAATCVGNVVTIDDVPVPSATILSEGVTSSSGYAILDDDKIYYVAKTSPDLKTLIGNLVTVLGNIYDALNGLDTAGFLIAATAGVPSPPLQAANIALINTMKTQLNTFKDALK